mgnify:CR=1 FL=1|jgi:hypothetical protein
MSTLRPDARARRVAEAFRSGEPPPEDPLEAALYAVLSGDVETDVDLVVALDLYNGDEHHVIDALLLVRAEAPLVCEALGLAPRVLEVYRALFFDPDVFKHAFAARRYVASVRDTTEEYRAYELAIQEGPEVLLDRYRVAEPPPPDPVKTAQKVMASLAVRAREHRGRPLTSRHAQEALKVARAALDAAATVRSMQPKNGGDTAALRFELALTTQNHTVTAAESPVPVGELVRSGPTET